MKDDSELTRKVTDAGDTKRISIPSQWDSILNISSGDEMTLQIVQAEEGLSILMTPEDPLKKSEAIADMTDLK